MEDEKFVIDPIQFLRISEKRDSGKRNREEEKNKKKKRKFRDRLEKEEAKLSKEDSIDWYKEDLNIAQEILRKENLIRLRSLKYQGSEITEASSDSASKKQVSESKQLPKLSSESMIDRLLRLKKYYFAYHKITLEQAQAITKNEAEKISKNLKIKEQLLLKIKETQSSLNFNKMKKNKEDSEKRTKANSILNDIHSEIKKIINQENKNSVKLQSQRDLVKEKLNKISRNSNFISKYSSKNKKSHFINTKK